MIMATRENMATKEKTEPVKSCNWRYLVGTRESFVKRRFACSKSPGERVGAACRGGSVI